MTDFPKTIWHLRTTFDRRVAYPGEYLFTSGMVTNATRDPIFIGNSYYEYSCYPDHTPGIQAVNVSLKAGMSVPIPAWQLPVPNVREGQYRATISMDTWIWDSSKNSWLPLERIHPQRGEDFYIIQSPRFRAFVSRSNHDVDRPIVETIVSSIQNWGFDTHTVGINEIEICRDRIPDRIKEEITKADWVFAIATPRDIGSVQNLCRTLTWLHNEISFSFMAQRPMLLIADDTVSLDGLAATEKIPNIKYSARDLATFLPLLHALMPKIRRILIDRQYQQWKQERIREIEEIRYQSFMAGMVYQKRMLLEE